MATENDVVQTSSFQDRKASSLNSIISRSLSSLSLSLSSNSTINTYNFINDVTDCQTMTTQTFESPETANHYKQYPVDDVNSVFESSHQMKINNNNGSHNPKYKQMINTYPYSHPHPDFNSNNNNNNNNNNRKFPLRHALNSNGKETKKQQSPSINKFPLQCNGNTNNNNNNGNNINTKTIIISSKQTNSMNHKSNELTQGDSKKIKKFQENNNIGNKQWNFHDQIKTETLNIVQCSLQRFPLEPSKKRIHYKFPLYANINDFNDDTISREAACEKNYKSKKNNNNKFMNAEKNANNADRFVINNYNTNNIKEPSASRSLRHAPETVERQQDTVADAFDVVVVVVNMPEILNTNQTAVSNTNSNDIVTQKTAIAPHQLIVKSQINEEDNNIKNDLLLAKTRNILLFDENSNFKNSKQNQSQNNNDAIVVETNEYNKSHNTNTTNSNKNNNERNNNEIIDVEQQRLSTLKGLSWITIQKCAKIHSPLVEYEKDQEQKQIQPQPQPKNHRRSHRNDLEKIIKETIKQTPSQYAIELEHEYLTSSENMPRTRENFVDITEYGASNKINNYGKNNNNNNTNIIKYIHNTFTKPSKIQTYTGVRENNSSNNNNTNNNKNNNIKNENLIIDTDSGIDIQSATNTIVKLNDNDLTHSYFWSDVRETSSQEDLVINARAVETRTRSQFIENIETSDRRNSLKIPLIIISSPPQTPPLIIQSIVLPKQQVNFETESFSDSPEIEDEDFSNVYINFHYRCTDATKHSSEFNRDAANRNYRYVEPIKTEGAEVISFDAIATRATDLVIGCVDKEMTITNVITENNIVVENADDLELISNETSLEVSQIEDQDQSSLASNSSVCASAVAVAASVVSDNRGIDNSLEPEDMKLEMRSSNIKSTQPSLGTTTYSRLKSERSNPAIGNGRIPNTPTIATKTVPSTMAPVVTKTVPKTTANNARSSVGRYNPTEIAGKSHAHHSISDRNRVAVERDPITSVAPCATRVTDPKTLSGKSPISSVSVDASDSVLPSRTRLRRQRRMLSQDGEDTQEDPIERLNRLRARISGALSEVKGVLNRYSTENEQSSEQSTQKSPQKPFNSLNDNQKAPKETQDEDKIVRFRFVKKIRRRSVFSEDHEDEAIPIEKESGDTQASSEPKVDQEKVKNSTIASNESAKDTQIDVPESKSSEEIKPPNDKQLKSLETDSNLEPAGKHDQKTNPEDSKSNQAAVPQIEVSAPDFEKNSTVSSEMQSKDCQGINKKQTVLVPTNEAITKEPVKLRKNLSITKDDRRRASIHSFSELISDLTHSRPRRPSDSEAILNKDFVISKLADLKPLEKLASKGKPKSPAIQVKDTEKSSKAETGDLDTLVSSTLEASNNLADSSNDGRLSKLKSTDDSANNLKPEVNSSPSPAPRDSKKPKEQPNSVSASKNASLESTSLRPKKRLSVKKTDSVGRRASIAAVEQSKIEPPVRGNEKSSMKTQRRPSDSAAVVKKAGQAKATTSLETSNKTKSLKKPSSTVDTSKPSSSSTTAQPTPAVAVTKVKRPSPKVAEKKQKEQQTNENIETKASNKSAEEQLGAIPAQVDNATKQIKRSNNNSPRAVIKKKPSIEISEQAVSTTITPTTTTTINTSITTTVPTTTLPKKQHSTARLDANNTSMPAMIIDKSKVVIGKSPATDTGTGTDTVTITRTNDKKLAAIEAEAASQMKVHINNSSIQSIQKENDTASETPSRILSSSQSKALESTTSEQQLVANKDSTTEAKSTSSNLASDSTAVTDIVKLQTPSETKSIQDPQKLLQRNKNQIDANNNKINDTQAGAQQETATPAIDGDRQIKSNINQEIQQKQQQPAQTQTIAKGQIPKGQSPEQVIVQTNTEIGGDRNHENLKPLSATIEKNKSETIAPNDLELSHALNEKSLDSVNKVTETAETLALGTITQTPTTIKITTTTPSAETIATAARQQSVLKDEKSPDSSAKTIENATAPVGLISNDIIPSQLATQSKENQTSPPPKEINSSLPVAVDEGEKKQTEATAKPVEQVEQDNSKEHTKMPEQHTGQAAPVKTIQVPAVHESQSPFDVAPKDEGTKKKIIVKKLVRKNSKEASAKAIDNTNNNENKTKHEIPDKIHKSTNVNAPEQSNLNVLPEFDAEVIEISNIAHEGCSGELEKVEIEEVVETPVAPPKKERKIKKKVIIKCQKCKIPLTDTFFKSVEDTTADAEATDIETIERAVAYVTDDDDDDDSEYDKTTASQGDTVDGIEVSRPKLKTCMKTREYGIGEIVLYAERFKKTQIRWKKARVIDRITSISYKLDVEGKEVSAHIMYIKRYNDHKVHFGSKEYLEIDYEQIAEERRTRSYSIWNMV